jgi:hypothetical protein
MLWGNFSTRPSKLTSYVHATSYPDQGSSEKDNAIPSDKSKNSLPCHIFHTRTLDFPDPGILGLFWLKTPSKTSKYRIKVTWRRQSHLFAYLKERGKLSRS